MFLLLGGANSRDPVMPRASAVPAFSWEGSRLPFVFLPSRFIILADPALLLFEDLRAGLTELGAPPRLPGRQA